MNKQLLILLLILSQVLACKKEDSESPVEEASVSTKPNILLVIADDMGIEACPGYDIGTIKPNMPHLQSMMASGVTFDNVWSYPLCSPTRSSILTGRYGYRTGVLNVTDQGEIPSSETSIQTYLDLPGQSQYEHAIFGKWHLSNNPSSPTDMGAGTYAGLILGALSDYFSWPFTEDQQTSTYQGYCTSKFTDLAISWMKEKQDPWFCWLAYTAPHTPFHLPPAEMHQQGSLPDDEASIEANPMPYFMAMMESMDYELGRIQDSLPQSTWENTVVIFLGDNGSHRNVIQSPFVQNKAKGTLYQGGVHVPMIVSGPLVHRFGAHDENLISTADLFSTIAEMTGLSLPQYEDSFSFLPLLSEEGEGARKYNYSEISDPDNGGFTIRDEQYKYVQFDNGTFRFYDLFNDPYESSNIQVPQLSVSESEARENLILQADSIRQ